MKWLVILSLTAVTASAASWQVFHTGRPASGGDDTLSAATRAPVEVQGIGYVEPASEVRKLLLRTGGVIKRYYFRSGDTVRKGETILELEDATQRAEVEVARKNLELAQAEADHVNAGTNPYKIKVTQETVERLREKVRHSRTEAERYRKLIDTRSATHQEYEANETQLRQAEMELREQKAELDYLRKVVTPEQRAMLEAKVRHARANLQLAQERLRETTLAAPFDGTVLKQLKRAGEGMSTSLPEPVVLFGDLRKLRVRAEIDERFVRHLAEGQTASVFGRNLAGKTYVGRVVDLEKIMGDKTVFARASSERKDLNVLQVVLDMGEDFQTPIGLQVDVKIEIQADGDRPSR